MALRGGRSAASRRSSTILKSGFEEALDSVLDTFSDSEDARVLRTPDSVEWVRDFSSIAYDDFGVLPITVSREHAKEILMDLFPEEVLPDREETIPDIIPSLRTFFTWLPKHGASIDAEGVLEVLGEVEQEFVSRMRNEELFGPDKKKVIAARKKRERKR